MNPCEQCKAVGFGECNGPHLGELPRRLHLLPAEKPTAEDRRLLILYGITSHEKARVLEFQGGGCAICGKPPVNIALGSDHDHKTGLFRGLLCRQHNKGLTLFGDDPVLLERAAAYLRNYPSMQALGTIHRGRTGRSTRKWRTKTERRDRMAWVKERIKQLWPSAK